MFDLTALIKAAGYLGLFGIVFAESGLFVGFFLPGDSLLFTAGFLASQGFLNILILAPLMFVAAVLGDNVGYAFGHRVGPKIFSKEESLFFHKDHLVRAEQFFNKYGAKTIVLARFVPVVRTFAPILAGAGRMNYREFLFYNVIGGLLWAVGLTVLGFFLGNAIPDIDHYIIPIVLVMIGVSFMPIFWHLFKDKVARDKFISTIKSLFNKKPPQ